MHRVVLILVQTESTVTQRCSCNVRCTRESVFKGLDVSTSTRTLGTERGRQTFLHIPRTVRVSRNRVSPERKYYFWHSPIGVLFSVSSNSICSISVVLSYYKTHIR
jgi:hypothetical protein